MPLPRIRRFFHLVFVLYFVEAGAFLLLAPWSRFWTARVVLPSPRALESFLESSYLRGFVAGIGLVHLIFAVRELERWRRATPERPLLRRLAPGRP